MRPSIIEPAFTEKLPGITHNIESNGSRNNANALRPMPANIFREETVDLHNKE
jgi:hypothetical protein